MKVHQIHYEYRSFSNVFDIVHVTLVVIIGLFVDDLSESTALYKHGAVQDVTCLLYGFLRLLIKTPHFQANIWRDTPK
jgi:hypothetical protein